MRMTKRTNIAMRVLMYCAVNHGRLVRKVDIAEACECSENHLAQVVNQLSNLGYLNTLRGRNGGIELGRNPQRIRIGEIFRALEGEVEEGLCFADVDQSCPLIAACRLREALQAAAEAFFARLDDVTLEELVCDNEVLAKILQPALCVS